MNTDKVIAMIRPSQAKPKTITRYAVKHRLIIDCETSNPINIIGFSRVLMRVKFIRLDIPIKDKIGIASNQRSGIPNKSTVNIVKTATKQNNIRQLEISTTYKLKTNTEFSFRDWIKNNFGILTFKHKPPID